MNQVVLLLQCCFFFNFRSKKSRLKLYELNLPRPKLVIERPMRLSFQRRHSVFKWKKNEAS